MSVTDSQTENSREYAEFNYYVRKVVYISPDEDITEFE